MLLFHNQENLNNYKVVLNRIKLLGKFSSLASSSTSCPIFINIIKYISLNILILNQEVVFKKSIKYVK